MNKVFTIFFLITSIIIHAQIKDTTYLNSDWEISEISEAKYYRVSKMNLDSSVSVFDYYRKGNTPMMIGRFQSQNLETKIGKFIYFYSSGDTAAMGSYNLNGEKTGLWKTYGPNNQFCCELTYENGITNGIGNNYYRNGVQKETTQFVNGDRKGWNKMYRKDGSLKQEREFIDGYFTGNYRKYSKDGKLKKEVIIESVK